MKNLTKKFLISILTLTFAVVCLGTSTFAWFSMNTKVTASQMQVHAKASNNLLISEAKASGYAASITFTAANTTMEPCSTVKSGTPAFFKLSDVGGGYVTINATAAIKDDPQVVGTKYYTLNETTKDYELEATGAAEQVIGEGWYTIATAAAPVKATTASNTTTPVYYLLAVAPATNAGDYVCQTVAAEARLAMEADSYEYAANTTFDSTTTDYVNKTMYLMSTGSAATNIKCDIEVESGGSEALDPSLRILLVVKSTANGSTEEATSTYLYAPLEGEFVAYSPISAVTDGKPTKGEQINSVSGSGDVVIASLKADTAATVAAYIWFEGQDTNCKMTNAVTLDTTTFKFSFYTE